jgi:hypothetical protein
VSPVNVGEPMRRRSTPPAPLWASSVSLHLRWLCGYWRLNTVAPRSSSGRLHGSWSRSRAGAFTRRSVTPDSWLHFCGFHAAAQSSLSAPLATILSASSRRGLCSPLASSHGAHIQTSRSSSHWHVSNSVKPKGPHRVLLAGTGSRRRAQSAPSLCRTASSCGQEPWAERILKMIARPTCLATSATASAKTDARSRSLR